MITCPNCGTRNEPGSQFCSECGANLGSLTSSSDPAQPTQPIPPVNADRPIWVAGQGWVKPPPSWPAQPPPQAAEPRPRRFWLWVIIAAIGLLIVVCCISSVYLQTSSGQHFYHNIQTRAAKEN